MTRRWILAMSIGLAIVLATATFAWLSAVDETEGDTSDGDGDLVTVIVSTREIAPGESFDELIETGAVKSVHVPRYALVQYAVTSLDQLDGMEAVSRILKHEQISRARVRFVGNDDPMSIL